MRRTVLIGTTLALAVLAGCGKHSDPAQPAPVKAASVTTTPGPLDAAAVLAKLTAAKLGLSNGKIQTAADDPNHQIGRAGGYLSRASFDLPGGDATEKPFDIARGGVVEVFADEAGAKAREAYITNAVKAMPALAEYHHLHGTILVRVAGPVSPDLDKRIGAVVDAL